MAQSTPGVFAPAKIGPLVSCDRTTEAATYELIDFHLPHAAA
ncbi:hypothetical protein [Actinocorallia populi]|nr:hypothetical protein [Actinocorallia populi]